MDEKKKALTKVLGGGLGGSAVVAILWLVDARTEALQKEISVKDTAIRQYVDTKHDQVSERLFEIQKTLEKIDNRLYDLKKKGEINE